MLVVRGQQPDAGRARRQGVAASRPRLQGRVCRSHFSLVLSDRSFLSRLMYKGQSINRRSALTEQICSSPRPPPSRLACGYRLRSSRTVSTPSCPRIRRSRTSISVGSTPGSTPSCPLARRGPRRVHSRVPQCSAAVGSVASIIAVRVRALRRVRCTAHRLHPYQAAQRHCPRSAALQTHRVRARRQLLVTRAAAPCYP